jgi:hypothetical protein
MNSSLENYFFGEIFISIQRHRVIWGSKRVNAVPLRKLVSRLMRMVMLALWNFECAVDGGSLQFLW